MRQIVDRDLRKGVSEGSELTVLESDRRRETRSLRFPLDSRSQLGRMDQRAAGEMADAGDRLPAWSRGFHYSVRSPVACEALP